MVLLTVPSAFSSFYNEVRSTRRITRTLLRLRRRGQNGSRSMRDRAGATPRTFWAAESRAMWVAPAQAAFFVRGLFSGIGACSRLVWRRLRERATERESLN